MAFRRSTVRSWLEAMLPFNGLDAEKARQLLSILDEQEKLRALAVDAGLIEWGDTLTDPLPLIRMFLPVD